MSRFVVSASLVLLAGCNCPGALTNTQLEPVRFSTTPLRFPDTAVGAETVLQLELTNPSRVSQTVTVRIDAPFFTASSQEVPAGSTEALSITFRPSEPGETIATLHLDEAEVPVSGLALAPPLCAGSVCTPGRFDLFTMQCTVDVLADGTSCSDGCVEVGQCDDGVCVGTGSMCDDADVCTVDACGDEGCLHVPRECPAVDDPCQVPSCDSQTGCASRDADDGTLCGNDSCITAEVKVCISGQCVARPRPDTAQCSKTWVPLVIPATWNAKLAWDSVNEHLITVVGGQTWSWDGMSWVQLFPPASLPNESYEFAVDSWRKRVVAWSGQDTYEWDGKTWLFRGTEVEFRNGPALAYDVKRRRVVRFGGSGLNGHTSDTWEWDGSRWHERTPVHVPPKRAFASMAWDPVRQKVVLFGGADTNFAKLSDTWEWDGNDWRLVPVNQPPPARFGATLTWDPTRLSLLLVGGTFQTAVRDVWALNGPTWTQLNSNDIAVSGHGAERDPVRGEFIVFSLGGTWRWDGSRFISRKALAPNPRQHMAMAWDATNATTVSFGGIPVPLQTLDPLDELWLKNASGWFVSAVTPKPAGRHRAGMAWDPVRQRVLLFGGSSEFGSGMGPVGQRFNDTWTWDGVMWLQRMPVTSPAAGAVADTTWDSATKHVVVLTTQDGTWDWDGNEWSRRAPASPLTTWESAIEFDRTSQRLLMVTGTRTWELDADGGWKSIASATLPANIGTPRLVWDEQGNRVLLHDFNGTFAWDGSTWVDLQPRVKPFSHPEALVFDGAIQRVTAYTANDEWVYLP
ncbi:MAG: hypothetical protein ACO1OB_24995 [Archangium sp.]